MSAAAGKADWIKLLVKYKGRCAQCGRDIQQGDYALWSRTSKAIKHENCDTGERTPEPRKGKQIAEGNALSTVELECFICGRPAGCVECGFSADCNRAAVSQACICNNCFSNKNAYENYRRAFSAKVQRIVAKFKI